jgi:hypothetical protein
MTIKDDDWIGHVATMGEMRNAYKITVGKPETKETTRKTWAKVVG